MMLKRNLQQINSLIEATKNRLKKYNEEKTEIIKNTEVSCNKCNTIILIQNCIRYAEYRSIPYEDYGEYINKAVLCPICISELKIEEIFNIVIDSDTYIYQYLEADLYRGYNETMYRFYKYGREVENRLFTLEKIKNYLGIKTITNTKSS